MDSLEPQPSDQLAACGEPQPRHRGVGTPDGCSQANDIVDKRRPCSHPLSHGLGGGVALFDRVVLAQARGHYDSLSDFTHPSIITVRQMTCANVQDGYISDDWHVEPDDVARQVWNCGAMHAQATKLIAGWLGLPIIDEVDNFLDHLAAATDTPR